MGTCTTRSSCDKDDKSQILTPHDVHLIKTSWKGVVKGGLAKYGTDMMIRVFLEHREMKPLWKFARNLDTQEEMNSNQLLKAHGEKLFNAIDMAVGSLDDLNTLVPILIQLGYSHYSWGVRDEHFPVIAECLISTLQDGLKEEFTPKIKKAWIKVFGVIEAQMKIGMRQYESESKAPKPNNNKDSTGRTDINNNNNNNSNNNTYYRQISSDKNFTSNGGDHNNFVSNDANASTPIANAVYSNGHVETS